MGTFTSSKRKKSEYGKLKVCLRWEVRSVPVFSLFPWVFEIVHKMKKCIAF